MRSITIALLIIYLASGQANPQVLSITGPARLVMQEGSAYLITWDAEDIDQISMVARGSRTPLGREERGDFDIVIADGVWPRLGSFIWTVPWIDAKSFYVEIKGYDADGNQISSAEREYEFRPASLSNKWADGIYLDLLETINQRLYVQISGRITHVYLCTSSRNYDWQPANNHIETPHDHAGVFRIVEKIPLHWSRLFHMEMPWAMRYNGGHFIHATNPSQYEILGVPASSGCNRLTYEDAQELYSITPVGTRVEIIGPDG